MRSLDDMNILCIRDTKHGLTVPFDIIKGHLNENKKVRLEIEIENLKPKDDEMDRDSQVSYEGE